jgi:hypothetical protein
MEVSHERDMSKRRPFLLVLLLLLPAPFLILPHIVE